MEEIQVREYVRTKDGYIRKVKDIICKGYPIKKLEGYIVLDDEDRTILNPEEVRHSFNIIDLIEIGDFVNGYRIDERAEHDVLIHKARGINRSGFMIPVAQYNEDIRTILTHEQYEINSYKVEGE